MRSVPLLLNVSDEIIGPWVPVREKYRYVVVEGLSGGEVRILGDHIGKFLDTVVVIWQDGRYEVDFTMLNNVKAIFENGQTSPLSVYIEDE
jgi:hypothetical protein